MLATGGTMTQDCRDRLFLKFLGLSNYYLLWHCNFEMNGWPKFLGFQTSVGDRTLAKTLTRSVKLPFGKGKGSTVLSRKGSIIFAVVEADLYNCPGVYQPDTLSKLSVKKETRKSDIFNGFKNFHSRFTIYLEIIGLGWSSMNRWLLG